MLSMSNGRRFPIMKYFNTQMNKLVKATPELQKELKTIMKQMGLERSLALKALYHSEVADGGPYQQAYQALDEKK